MRGIVALCGAAAESRFSGELLTDVLHRQIDDLSLAREAATLLAMLGDKWHVDSRVRVFKQLLGEAEAFVDNNWHTILRVAEALQFGRTLNGAQIARLVHFANKKGSNHEQSHLAR